MLKLFMSQENKPSNLEEIHLVQHFIASMTLYFFVS